MKKYSLLLLVFLMTVITGSAQNRRLVLIEEFTNTGCGPCASWSPLLDSAIYYRLGDVVAIKYHSVYPNREDPFYLENSEAQQARVDYYQVNGVPATYVNGVELDTRTFSYLNAAIDYSLTSQPADYDLTLSKQLEGQQISVKATLTPHVDSDSRNLRLFVATIEEHIKMQCPNGEDELNYTMRSMLTNPEGTAIGELTAGDGASLLFEAVGNIGHFYDQKQIGALAFLQDMDTRQILATAYSGPDAEGRNQVALIDLFDTPDHICTPDYYGKVVFRNNGGGVISSAKLNVKVNGQVEQYDWQGTLNYLERDTLSFSGHSSFTLSTIGNNDVEVWFSDINGTSEQSNKRTSAFTHSVIATYGAQLRLYTDKKPEEITWKLYNSAGDIVREGGPYDGQARKFITENLELTADDCYHLELLDAGGDGIKGANGNGYYQLFQVNEAGKTQRLLQGDYSSERCDVFFRLNGSPKPEKRLVLFEEFTNTSCDPCADFSPALDRTIYERMTDMVAITYHYNFPSPQDPFYLANPTDVMARANFYGVSGVPALRVNGEAVGSWGYESYLDGYVTGAGEIPATVDLDAEASLSDGVLTVGVSLVPTGVTDGSNLRLHVAAVEERIEWAQPAANGERAWNYVMRKLLTGTEGQPLEAELSKVTPYNYEFSWKVENYADENELGIVTFVQDNTTREVLGAVYTPRPTGSRHAAKVIQVLNAPKRLCSAAFAANVVVRNTGRETLRSATLNVSINNQVQRTPWTGTVDYLAIDTIQAPLFTEFTLQEATPNNVEIWLSDLNGSSEESVHYPLVVTNAHKAQNAVRLTVMTDQHPDEITWQLFNSAGELVREGGPYEETRKRQVIDFNLDVDDCYMLVFNDAAGNGIAEGRGYYMLHEVNSEGKTRLLTQADYSGAHHEVYFSLENAATSSIQYFAAPSQPDVPAYDLQGRPATERTQVVVREGKMTVNK